MRYTVIAVIALFICSAFIGDDPHAPEYDAVRCETCHTEFLRPFDSYKADMRYYKGGAVVVTEERGEFCNVAGVHFSGWIPCAALTYPLNIWEFKVVSG